MKPELSLLPSLVLGTLKACATFQDPDVRLTERRGQPPAVHLEEGGVLVVLEFPDRESLERFQRRLAHLHLPRRDRG